MTVTLPPPNHGRLADLLLDPRETLDVEIKGWLDLARNEEHKATLAKALLALANSGGGFVLIGFDEGPTGPMPASGRPPTLDVYSQDVVNGIVRNYAEPAFHCSVHYEAHPTSGVFPIIGVPGGHRVPVRAKRSGPNGEIVLQHSVYIRKPGPRSEQPLTGREWDELFTRCLDSRRDELLERMRDLLTGRPESASDSQTSRLDAWIDDCERQWRTRVETLPVDSPSRCPHGFFVLAYQLEGARRPGLSELMEILRNAPKLTGWNTWWAPTRQAIAPYVRDDVIECWLGGDTSEGHQEHRDAAHADFWRISPDGFAFLLRGYQEDGSSAGRVGIEPGTVFDGTLPIWRVGEGLLHSGYLAGSLGAASVLFAARYTGLQGRMLTQWVQPMDLAWASGVSRQDTVSVSTHVASDAVSPNLADVVQRLLSPLYERFDFSTLPLEVVQQELDRLRKRQ